MTYHSFDSLTHTMHTEFITGPVEFLDWDMDDCRMDFTYRDGTTRTVTGLPEMRYHQNTIVSYDGKYLVTCCHEKISIHCK